MPIEFACSSCSKQVRVPDGSEGKKCKCPECQTILSVPKVEVEAVEIKLEVPCPRCDFVLVCDPSLEGTRGLCPNCKLIFTIEPPGSNANAEQVASLQLTFAFQCPHCKQLFEGKPGMEGRNGKCIHCHQVFEIKKYIDPISTSTQKKTNAITASLPKKAKPVESRPTQAANTPRPSSPKRSGNATTATKRAAPIVPVANDDWLGSLPLPSATAIPYSGAMNPYAVSAAPANYGAAQSDSFSGDAASVRRNLISHESAIKGFGLLYAIGAGFYIFIAVAATIFGLFVFASFPKDAGPAIGTMMLIYAAVYFTIGTLVGLVSTGLYKLSDVGKIGGSIFSVLGLCAVPIGTLLGAYMLYLMFSEKGNYIFSQRYRSIVKQTPHIKCHTPVFVWIILACFGLLIMLGVVLFVVSFIGASR